MVVVVLIMSCQVLFQPKINPDGTQSTIRNTEKINHIGEPTTLFTFSANFSKPLSIKLRIWLRLIHVNNGFALVAVSGISL